MRVHVLQHVEFEGVASIGEWLRANATDVSHTRFHESPTLPDATDLDLIIAMGGPMSVNDETELPWLVAEKQFIRDAIRQGAAVLGICLGAQLIASALSARVYPGQHREIGWFEIESTSTDASVFQFPKTATVFHWHGETFDLPAGAVRLARSAACENQAFQVGPNVIGLQFHLETTPASADAIVSHCGHELSEGTYVQSESTIRAVAPAIYERNNQLMAEILSYLTRLGDDVHLNT